MHDSCLASDEGRVEVARASPAAAGSTRTSRNAATGSALPFSSSGSSACASTASRTSASVCSPSRISPGCRRLLKARGDVDCVPDRHVLALAADDRASVDAGPEAQRDADLFGDRRQPLPDLGRRPHRTQGVVLVHLRDPEHRHHRVADELLDRPTVTAFSIVSARISTKSAVHHHGAAHSGSSSPRRRGRPRHVAEQRRHDLPRLPRRSFPRAALPRTRHRSAAPPRPRSRTARRSPSLGAQATPAASSRRQRIATSSMPPLGLEPRTFGLKVRCSTN